MGSSLKCFILGCWFQHEIINGVAVHSIIRCKWCKDLLTMVDGQEYRGWYQQWKGDRLE